MKTHIINKVSKLHYYLLGALVASLALSLLMPARAEAFAGGDGSEGSPYQIINCAQLQSINDQVENFDLHYILNNDIDCSMTNPEDPDWDDEGLWANGEGFVPIGWIEGEGWNNNPFMGSFDGNDKKITGLFIDRDLNRQGLFGQIGDEVYDEELSDWVPVDAGLVQDLTIEDAYVDCQNAYTTGILVGVLYGTANNVDTSGEVHCTYEAGGLVGGHDGWDTINNSSSSATVYGHSAVGGLVGSNWDHGNIVNSFATGNVYGGSNVGGLAGSNNEGSISGSYSTGTVYMRNIDSWDAITYIGGLIGYSSGEVTNSYSTSDIRLESNTDGLSYLEYVGGLIGYAYANISNSYAEGGIEFTTTDGVDVYEVGGLVGYAEYLTINQSDADVVIDITSSDDIADVGGLVGEAYVADISSATSDGNLTVVGENGASYVGGMIGYMYDAELTDSSSTGDLDITSSVNSVAYIGGFVGQAEDSILEGVGATGNIVVMANSVNISSIGGFIGETYDSVNIEEAYSTGDIDLTISDPESAIYQVGGFAGSICQDDYYCTIERSYSKGDININTQDLEGENYLDVAEIGGFIGEAYYLNSGEDYINGNFTESNITIDLSSGLGGSVESVGGFIGDFEQVDSDTLISDNYSRSNITINAPDDNAYVDDVGGFLGSADDDSDATITNSYYAGAINITAGDYIEDVGGFIGYAYAFYTEDNFAASSISLNNDNISDEYVAAFVGYDDVGDNDYYTNNYAFESTGDWNFCYGTDSGLDGGDGCSIVAGNSVFKNAANQPLSEWDFEDLWTLDTDGVLNAGYPYFNWYEPSPDGDDLNGDGTPDSLQPHVESITNPLTGKTVVLELEGGSCDVTSLSTSAETSLGAQDTGYSYANGLVNFTADCEDPTTTVKIYHYGVNIADLVVRKHNPNTNAFFTIDSAIKSQETINSQTVAVASYQVTDGGELDMDGTENGAIVDPVGLATGVLGVPNTGLGE